jgi:hypothetical protein
VESAIHLLKLLRKSNNENNTATDGLRIVNVVTTAPHPVTFVFEGTQLALDINMFILANTCYPINSGDRFFALPIVGDSYNRWGLIGKV